MKAFHILSLACACLIAGAAFSQSPAPAPSRVRGTITAFDGTTVSVKTREGKDLKIELAPNATFAYMKKVSYGDIKAGTPLGATTVKGADSKVVAREVHLFNPDRPVPNEGSRPWDSEPDSMMTNGRVSAVKGSELTLGFSGIEQIVVVPDNTPIVIAVESDRSAVVVGEYAYIATAGGPDGKLIASRLQLSRDGVRPPQ